MPSGHHRAKNVGYDADELYSDEYEDYEEPTGDETTEETEEDKEKMRIGKAGVKEALGSSVSYTDAQIEKALWDNWYDVEESVSELKSSRPLFFYHKGVTDQIADKYMPKPKPQPKQQKAPSRFDQAASAAGSKMPTPGKQNLEMLESSCPVPPFFALRSSTSFFCSTRAPCSTDFVSARARDFFWDTPWGNVPSHRVGIITVMEPAVKGGLLGGSSKLQQLAAKRKQQKEAATTPVEAKSGTNEAVALLDKLTVKDKASEPSIRGGGDAPRRPLNRYPRKRSPSPTSVEPEVIEESIPEPPKPIFEFPNLRAKPSMFGSTLCGVGHRPQKRPRVVSLSSFTVPYATMKAFKEADPFAKPSPDDIVKQAQARGARQG